MAVPEGAELAAAPQLEMELVRLTEPDGRVDAEPARSVDELELPIRRLCGGFQNERLSSAAAHTTRPDIDGSTVLIDVLTNIASDDELHMAKSRYLIGNSTSRGR